MDNKNSDLKFFGWILMGILVFVVIGFVIWYSVLRKW